MLTCSFLLAFLETVGKSKDNSVHCMLECLLNPLSQLWLGNPEMKQRGLLVFEHKTQYSCTSLV